MEKYEAVYFFQFHDGEHTLEQVEPFELRSDMEVVLAAVKWGKGQADNLLLAGPELLDDSGFARKLSEFAAPSRAMKHLSERLRNDDETVLAFVSAWKGGANLEFASSRLKADDKVVRAALKTDGSALAYVPASRRGEPELLDIAYKNCASAVAHLPMSMLEDRDFWLDFLSVRHAKEGLLQYLPTHFRDDRELVMQILMRDAASLEFANDTLRSDPEVVLLAMFKPISNDLPAMGFEFASEANRRDKAFVAKAIERLKDYRPEYRRQFTTAIKDVHKLAVSAAKGAGAAEITELKAALRDIRKALQDTSVRQSDTDELTTKLDALRPRLKTHSDHAALMTAWVEADYLRNPLYCKTRGDSVGAIAPSLMLNRKFLVGLMKVSEGAVLSNLDPAFQGDAEFVLETIDHKTPRDAIAPGLRRDSDFLAALIDRLQFIRQVQEIPEPEMWNNREFVLRMVASRGWLLESASPELRRDREVVLTAIAQNPDALKHADAALFQDRDLMATALKSGSSAAAERLVEPLVSDVDFLVECLQATEGRFKPMPRALMARVPRAVRSDRRFLVACLRCNGWGLENVPESLQYDAEILTAAFSSGVAAWKMLDLDRLRKTFSRAELETIVVHAWNLEEIFKD